jgi:pyridoxamine 5'-phosphate oxidase
VQILLKKGEIFMSIADIRRDYMKATLSEDIVDQDPFRQFTEWWIEATRAEIDEVNAMTLSTVSEGGRPAARIVLLKGYDENGFVFFTNYESRKGLDLKLNPYASLLFFWKELERQVRIDGPCEKVPDAESDEYFYSRPEGSRIGAWASPQSQVISSRDVLDQNIIELENRFQGKAVPRPPHWGGYRVRPDQMEFWQGRPSRLHDRILYTRETAGWKIDRLAP